MKRITVTQTEVYEFLVEDDEIPGVTEDDGYVKAEDWFCNKDNPVRDANKYEVTQRDIEIEDEQ